METLRTKRTMESNTVSFFSENYFLRCNLAEEVLIPTGLMSANMRQGLQLECKAVVTEGRCFESSEALILACDAD